MDFFFSMRKLLGIIAYCAMIPFLFAVRPGGEDDDWKSSAPNGGAGSNPVGGVLLGRSQPM